MIEYLITSNSNFIPIFPFIFTIPVYFYCNDLIFKPFHTQEIFNKKNNNSFGHAFIILLVKNFILLALPQWPE